MDCLRTRSRFIKCRFTPLGNGNYSLKKEMNASLRELHQTTLQEGSAHLLLLLKLITPKIFRVSGIFFSPVFFLWDELHCRYYWALFFSLSSVGFLESLMRCFRNSLSRWLLCVYRRFVCFADGIGVALFESRYTRLGGFVFSRVVKMVFDFRMIVVAGCESVFLTFWSIPWNFSQVFPQ